MGDPTEWFDETYVWVEADFTRLSEALAAASRGCARMTTTASTHPPVTALPNLIAIPRTTAAWHLPAVPTVPRPIDVALDILRPHLAWQPLYRPTT